MIMSCGYGAVVADICTFLAVSYIRKTMRAPTKEVVGFLHYIKKGNVSGGAIDAACSQIETYGLSRIDSASTFDAIAPRTPMGPSNKRNSLLSTNVFGVQRINGLGVLTTSFYDRVELPIVGRSWALYEKHKPDPQDYGPNFRFSSHMRVSNAFTAIIVRISVLVFTLLMTLAPVRTVLKRCMFIPGTGPSPEQRRKNYFTYRAIGIADTEAETNKQVMVELVYAGDPYDLTATAVIEAGLLLLDGGTEAHRLGGGVLTPATLGDKYAERLVNRQVRINIREISA